MDRIKQLIGLSFEVVRVLTKNRFKKVNIVHIDLRKRSRLDGCFLVIFICNEAQIINTFDIQHLMFIDSI